MQTQTTPKIEQIIEALAIMVSKKKGIDVASIKGSSTMQSLNLDSLDVLDLIFGAEHKYKIRFPKHYGEVNTLQDVANLTHQLIIEQSNKG